MRVHRNLHAARQGKPQWVETPKGRGARVVYHENMILRGVTTRIQPAAAAACEREQVRRVCAFFVGTPDLPEHDDLPAEGWKRIAYDPRTGGGFTCDGVEWEHADAVALNRDGSAYALNPWRMDSPATLNLFGGQA